VRERGHDRQRHRRRADDHLGPLDDGDACTDETCTAGVPAHVAKVCGAGVAPCTGTLGFPGLPMTQVGEGLAWVAVADLDGDGKPDLVVASHNHDAVGVHLNACLA
jgi:hypothetical protein